MQASFVSSISKFPSWVPQKSSVVNTLVLATSFSTASVSLVQFDRPSLLKLS
jgi:hypothetical protein